MKNLRMTDGSVVVTMNRLVSSALASRIIHGQKRAQWTYAWLYSEIPSDTARTSSVMISLLSGYHFEQSNGKLEAMELYESSPKQNPKRLDLALALISACFSSLQDFSRRYQMCVFRRCKLLRTVGNRSAQNLQSWNQSVTITIVYAYEPAIGMFLNQDLYFIHSRRTPTNISFHQDLRYSLKLWVYLRLLPKT